MKNKLELKLYKFIKYFFVGSAIVLPIGLLIIKYILKENIEWAPIIAFPILCIVIVKFMNLAIRKK